MAKLTQVLILAPLLVLTSCSSLPTSILGGGGPNVAANTQIGKENRQAVVSVEKPTSAGRDIVQKEIEAQNIEYVTIVQEKIPTWLLVAFGVLCGFVIPSPPEIARSIANAFRRKKNV